MHYSVDSVTNMMYIKTMNNANTTQTGRDEMSISIERASEILTTHNFKHRIDGNGEIEAWFRKNDRVNKDQPWEVVQFRDEQSVIDLIDSPSGY